MDSSPVTSSNIRNSDEIVGNNYRNVQQSNDLNNENNDDNTDSNNRTQNRKKQVETNYMITYDKNLRPQRVQEKSVERYVRNRPTNMNSTAPSSYINQIERNVPGIKNKNNTNNRNKSKGISSTIQKKDISKQKNQYSSGVNSGEIGAGLSNTFKRNNDTINNNFVNNDNFSKTINNSNLSKEKIKQNLNNARFEFKNKNIKNTSSNTFGGGYNNTDSINNFSSVGSGFNNNIMNNNYRIPINQYQYSNSNNNMLSSSNSQNIYNYQNQSMSNLQQSQEQLPGYNSGGLEGGYNQPQLHNTTGQFNNYNNFNMYSQSSLAENNLNLMSQEGPVQGLGQNQEDYYDYYNNNDGGYNNKFINNENLNNQFNQINEDYSQEGYGNSYAKEINNNNMKNINNKNNNNDFLNNEYNNNNNDYNNYKNFNQTNQDGYQPEVATIKSIKELQDSNRNPDESGNSLSSFTPSERTKDCFKREVLTEDKLKDSSIAMNKYGYNSNNNYNDYNASYKKNVLSGVDSLSSGNINNKKEQNQDQYKNTGTTSLNNNNFNKNLGGGSSIVDVEKKQENNRNNSNNFNSNTMNTKNMNPDIQDNKDGN